MIDKEGPMVTYLYRHFNSKRSNVLIYSDEVLIYLNEYVHSIGFRKSRIDKLKRIQVARSIYEMDN